jgi:hypothetical protein
LKRDDVYFVVLDPVPLVVPDVPPVVPVALLPVVPVVPPPAPPPAPVVPVALLPEVPPPAAPPPSDPPRLQPAIIMVSAAAASITLAALDTVCIIIIPFLIEFSN